MSLKIVRPASLRSLATPRNTVTGCAIRISESNLRVLIRKFLIETLKTSSVPVRYELGCERAGFVFCQPEVSATIKAFH